MMLLSGYAFDEFCSPPAEAKALMLGLGFRFHIFIMFCGFKLVERLFDFRK
jgi:hypothetical protein